MRSLARRPLRAAALITSIVVAVVALGAVIGRLGTAGGTSDPAAGLSPRDGSLSNGSLSNVDGGLATVDRLEQAIAQAQDRLRRLPADWETWAALSLAYLEESRITADPTWYPKAQEAAQRSLTVKPAENPDALLAQGALANARHDFATARNLATAVIAADGYSADGYAVLTDAETQLGHRDAATAAVQHLLDLRPGLSAYARGSYDLEQRGQVGAATDLMTRALSVAVDRHDIAFARTQLGDLALNSGALATAQNQYTAGLAADPGNVALQRGLARVAAARGQLTAAVSSYGTFTRRAPTPSNLIEYAALLNLTGRSAEANTQLHLAKAADDLFVASGGTDGLTATALAEALGDDPAALAAAQGEWARRQHADVADALAWALHLNGRDQEALTYAGTALSGGAHSAGYAYHRGLIELALGDRTAARTDLTAALAINPYFSPVDAPSARLALAGLEQS
jgi:tetratricopeptide (TPR) repeat protein